MTKKILLCSFDGCKKEGRNILSLQRYCKTHYDREIGKGKVDKNEGDVEENEEEKRIEPN